MLKKLTNEFIYPLTTEMFNAAIYKEKHSQNGKLITALSNTSNKSQTKLFGKSFSFNKTSLSNKYNVIAGSNTPFNKVLIIRGIGYRASVIENFNQSSRYDFIYKRYLLVRVGHSFNVYLTIPESIGIKILKKDRKLVVYSQNKNKVASFIDRIYKLRPPSIYTGRGIRKKGVPHVRKLGKKDLRKGKAF